MGEGEKPPDELLARIAEFEQRLQALREDFARLRWEVHGQTPLAARSAPAAPAAMVAPARVLQPVEVPRAAPGPDFEVLVGRYGMLALAAFLVLAAAGMFLSWAVSKGWLGPPVRLALGLLAAAGLAIWGMRVRRMHGAFGDSLLGIALATVHVCAWAAGPSLHLVATPLALAFSAVGSVGLAAFALREGDEPLWCIGFGGAALAPFVTSSGDGTAPMLAGYAVAVLVAGGSALGSRTWRIGGRVFGAAAALFTVALAIMPTPQHGPALALALPFVVAIGGAFPFAQGDTLRPRLRTLGFLGVVAAIRWIAVPVLPALAAPLVLAAAGVAWLVLVDRADTDPPGLLLDGTGDVPAALCDWVDGALLPGAYLALLLVAMEATPARAGAAAGLAAAVLLACAARRAGSPLRDALAAVSWGAAVAATLIELSGSPNAAAAALGGVSVLAVLVGRAVPSSTWSWAPFVSLAGASAWIFGLLTGRPVYHYVPFATRETVAAAAVAVAWAAAIRLSESTPARWTALTFVFFWFHQEFAFAVGPTASRLLLVTYYAVSSVAAVGFGRARDLVQLRRIGLVLALGASGLAIHAAFQLASTGARICACLVASAFLLGIAWWYRRPAADASAMGAEPRA